MNKYFETLDIVEPHVQNRPTSVKMRSYKNALRQEHGAGEEANYLIRLWLADKRKLNKRY